VVRKGVSWPFRSGILFNPEAGRNRRGDEKLLSDLKEAGMLRCVRSPEEVSSALTDLARAGANHLIISAGDGTVQACLTALFRKRPFGQIPPISVLPGGTTNLIAGDVGPKGTQARSVERLLKIIACPCTGNLYRKKRAVIRLASGSSADEGGALVRYGMFMGTGAVARAVSFYQKRLHESGLWGGPGIVLTILRYLWIELILRQGGRRATSAASAGKEGPVPDRTRIELDGGKTIQGEILLTLITTLERLFAGIHPFWADPGTPPAQGAKRPIKMTVVMRRPARPLRLLPRLLAGKAPSGLSQENGYLSLRFSQAEIHTGSALALDGELIHSDGQGPYRVSYGGQITFISW
jgi:hypothetical protein